MHLHSLLLFLFTLFLSARAAHVQFKDCNTPSTTNYSFKPNTASAFLNDTELGFEIWGNYPTIAACRRSLLDNASVELSLNALSGTRRYNGEIRNATCLTKEFKQINTKFFIQILDVLFDIDDPKPLAAYEWEINIDAPDHFSVACLTGFLTPDIGLTFQDMSFWIPTLTFIIVVFVAGWREWFNLLHPLRDDDENAQERSRSHLTRIADCLAYIQFIFFSSALSINQPGFLQPVVSSVSWSTLMLRRGIVWRQSVYYGIHDGIHEINGTFGGTSGLEHMTQVMAAPVTVSTWTNIATLAFVILVLLYAVIQIGLHLRWTRDWFQQSGTWIIESSTKQQHKATIWVALRVFLSYLLLPFTAWTTYQLDSASARPVYYTLLVVMVVALLIIACWWGMSSRSPQSMGYLLVDDLHKQTSEEPSRTQDYYTYVSFILIFARGVIIGGLQRFGTVQLFSLMACEVIQLSFLAWVGAAPGLLSKPVLISGARLTALLLCLGMIPDLWSHTAASALGYTLLMFHALFLIGMFLVPSTHEFGRLAVACCNEWRTAPERPARESSQELQPQVFGLRQLSRRPTTRTNLSRQEIHDNDRSSSLSSSANSSSDSADRSSRGSEPVSPELLRTYFRSPRPERSVSSLSDRRQFSSFETTRPERCASSFSPRHQQFPSFETTRPPTVYENPAERNSVASSQSTDSGDLGQQASPWSAILPSGSNVDYSFRETDLYYVKPRRVSFGNADGSSDDSGGQSSGWAGKLKFWS
ncbi:hypothetical protein F53441_10514 [Fusarium austroafricanum]|uniref:TRP C-terminal domain-containing protein n=1 Tax=Fusarium austroafricanum TaxID=2364996 RepID=A0A8H4K6T9_9HYPO|nr:hypothetical protein F53441_10514 [Fusarium austroafricanum]